VLEDPTRHGASEAPLATLVRSIRSMLGPPREAAGPRRRDPRVDPVRRPWLAGKREARMAVRAGIPLGEHLRERLAHYVAGLPVSAARLPIQLDVQDGCLVVRTPPAADGPAQPATSDGWLDALVDAEGPTVRQEVADLEGRAILLDGAVDTARARSEELARRFAADVAAGTVMGETAVEASAEQMGRPHVRGALPGATLTAFAASALLAATWQIAQPLLHGAGLDPERLDVLGLRTPAVALTILFALAIAAGTFGLLHGAVEAALALVRCERDAVHRRAFQLGAAGQALAAALVAAAVAALPLPETDAERWSHVVFLLAVPLAATLAVRAARAEAVARSAEHAEALAWDRERARALLERGRRLDEMAWAERLDRELRLEREAIRRRLREIGARAVAATRRAADARRREGEALARLARSLFAALEADRAEYLRLSAARGATDEGTGLRLRPEPRPLAVEHAAPPASGQVAAH
jgi:hypothetical protein